MTRRAAKIDRNQPEIVDTLRALGCSVKPCHAVGEGFPDLVVGVVGSTYLAEVKDGELPPSARKLSPGQVAFHDEWRGGRPVVLETVQQAIDWVASLRKTAEAQQ